jgi:putative hydrolase of the HAD superfamily
VIHAVTVDFWGTLIFDGPYADDRYRQRRLIDFASILAGAGLPIGIAALARGYAVSGRELGRIWSGNRDVPVEAHVAAILEGAETGLARRVSPTTVAALVEAYASPALLAPPSPDPTARVGLGTVVSRGIRLAVVSNTMRTPGVTLRKILAGHGLLDPFLHLTFSDEVGVRKPAPEIFHLTLERIGASPASSVHVGDDPVLDVEGALAAGMRVIQVVAGLAGRSTQADAVIRHLGELPDALARLEPGATDAR